MTFEKELKNYTKKLAQLIQCTPASENISELLQSCSHSVAQSGVYFSEAGIGRNINQADRASH